MPRRAKRPLPPLHAELLVMSRYLLRFTILTCAAQNLITYQSYTIVEDLNHAWHTRFFEPCQHRRPLTFWPNLNSETCLSSGTKEASCQGGGFVSIVESWCKLPRGIFVSFWYSGAGQVSSRWRCAEVSCFFVRTLEDNVGDQVNWMVVVVLGQKSWVTLWRSEFSKKWMLM